MIRFGRQQDSEALAELWDDCFPSDAAFRDLLLSGGAPCEFVVCDDGGLCGMLCFTEQPYVFHGISVPAAYIFGVGTRSDRRGNGVAGELMAFTLRELRSRGVALALLVPNGEKLFGFYERFGFTTAAYIERLTFGRDDVKAAGETIEPLCASNAYEANELFERVLRHRCHLGRTAAYWRFCAEASEKWGGGAVCVRRGGELAGYAICSRDGGGRVDELFAEDEAAFNALRLGLLELLSAERLTMNAPACPHGAKPYGMARVVDAGALLRAAIQHRPGDFEIGLDDALSGAETRRYVSRGGEIIESVSVGQVCLTPAEFTNIVIGDGVLPYMNLVFSDD